MRSCANLPGRKIPRVIIGHRTDDLFRPHFPVFRIPCVPHENRSLKAQASATIPRKLAWFLPGILVLFWLAFVSGQVWKKVSMAEQPPVYDTLTYFQKAKNF